MSIDVSAARARIQTERERLEKLVARLRAELGEEEPGGEELPDRGQDPAELGSEVFERQKDQAILERLETELRELDAALERIERGTYGIDEVTGEPIAAERLEAFPAARTNATSTVPR